MNGAYTYNSKTGQFEDTQIFKLVDGELQAVKREVPVTQKIRMIPGIINGIPRRG